MKKQSTILQILAFLFIVVGSVLAQDKQQEKPTIDTAPKFAGYVRLWHQSDFSTDLGAFLVKDARFGVTGNVNEYASYKFLIDVVRLGKLTTTTDTINGRKFLTGATASFSDVLLDAQATLKPFDNFALSLGQFKIPFSTENLKSTETMDFVNTPLHTNVAPASRDIGLMAAYKFTVGVPIDVFAGLFNGTGINKPENDKTSDYVGRIVVKPIKSVGVSANYYGGKSGVKDISVMDFGADWTVGSLVLDAEYVSRQEESPTTTVKSNAYFAYATYTFTFENSMLKNVIPTVRYESYDPNGDVASNEIGRITFGVSLQFAKITFAQFKVNYEKFDYKALAAGASNPDKLIFEIQTRF